MMKVNMGNADRIIRIVLGLIIIGLGFMYESYWGLLGLIPLFTAFVRFCPAYLPFGISTCERRSQGPTP